MVFYDILVDSKFPWNISNNKTLYFQAVLYASGNILTIKALAPNSKPLQWVAHEALVLCVDWSATNGKIVSGNLQRLLSRN